MIVGELIHELLKYDKDQKTEINVVANDMPLVPADGKETEEDVILDLNEKIKDFSIGSEEETVKITVKLRK